MRLWYPPTHHLIGLLQTSGATNVVFVVIALGNAQSAEDEREGNPGRDARRKPVSAIAPDDWCQGPRDQGGRRLEELREELREAEVKMALQKKCME